METMLTVRQVATRLALSPPHVRQLIAQGTIPGLRIGKLYRVPEQEFETWLKAQISRPRD